MERFDLAFRQEKVKPVFRLGDSRVVQLSLPAGGVLDKHKTPHTLVFVVISGEVRFAAGSETQLLRAGDGVIVEPAREHAVEALVDSVALLHLIPAPTQQPDVAPATPAQPVCVYTQPQLREQIDPALRPLVDDHAELCAQLAQVQGPFDRQRVQSLVEAVGRELAQHFVAEENTLFPRLAQHLGGPDVGPVPKLLKEHAQVRELHSACEKLLAAWDEPAPIQGRADIERLLTQKLRELTTLLWSHIEKEDTHLFTMASRILTPEEKAAIAMELAQYA
ncbi:MAG: hemerythrin domain-containing protein [Alicyclobacillus sp.]|nr:hemerythrin domain-containing protein [Alicyclobacillus sp.]